MDEDGHQRCTLNWMNLISPFPHCFMGARSVNARVIEPRTTVIDHSEHWHSEKWKAKVNIGAFGKDEVEFSQTALIVLFQCKALSG